MSFRSAEIAVQPQTIKRLNYVLKLFPVGQSPDEARRLNADGLADRLLNEVIAERYPAVIELEKKLKQIEQEAIERAKVS